MPFVAARHAADQITKNLMTQGYNMEAALMSNLTGGDSHNTQF
jgi:hypothetical protein